MLAEKSSESPRMTAGECQLVAVLPDRIKAEEAYSALEKEGLPTNQIDILGTGYKSADEYGFIDPNQQAKKGATRLSSWLIPFGFVAGYAFNLLTGISVFTVIATVCTSASVDCCINGDGRLELLRTRRLLTIVLSGLSKFTNVVDTLVIWVLSKLLLKVGN